MGGEEVARASAERRDVLAAALAEIRQLKARLAAAGSPRDPIAIVGLDARFPGADDRDSVWDLLRTGRCALGPEPIGRRGVPPRAGLPDAGYLDDPWGFDDRLFRVPPREAAGMDPQHRLLLEVAWSALESAGVAPDRLSGSRTGTWVGISHSDWASLHGAAADASVGTGTPFSFAPGRLAWRLGLQGPAIALDTACSSSLVAVHLAVSALRARSVDLALAGGVNLILAEETSALLARSGALSPTGRCHTFDAAADGYARGEGCGVVVLARLEDALRQGLPVVAVLRGSAVAHDGASSGLTVPNPSAQEAVIRAALDDGGLTPDDVECIEAHGTGTPLGDPIEVRALARVFGARTQPLGISSVKTNLGHLEAASGIAGLIKAALSVQHGFVPPHIGLRTPNPAIPWSEAPVRVETALRPFRTATRRVGVSAFGASGTLAHVVIEAPPERAAPGGAAELAWIPITAQDDAGCRSVAAALADRLAGEAPPVVPRVVETLAHGRPRLAARAAAVGADVAGLVAALRGIALGQPVAGAVEGEPRGRSGAPVFLFTGQGAQRPGMGQAWLAQDSRGREAWEDAILRFESLGAPGLRARLLAGAPTDDPVDAQASLFCLQWALTASWEARGVRPAAVIGHSLGEYAALAAVGALDLEGAVALVHARASLLRDLPPGGAMCAIFASEAEVRSSLGVESGRVDVAAVNDAAECVISGDDEAVSAIAAAFERAGVRVRRLDVTHAFHSPRLDPILERFRQVARGVAARRPRVPVAWNTTGALDAGRLVGPDDLVAHLRGAVRFGDGLRALLSAGHETFLEVGPGPVLCSMGRRAAPDAAWIASLRPPRPDALAWRDAEAALWTRGALDVTQVVAERGAGRIALPGTPLRRRRYGPPAGTPHDTGAPRWREVRSPAVRGRLFEAELGARDLPLIAEHAVYGRVIVSGAVHLGLVVRAITGRVDGAATLSEVAFDAPMFADDARMSAQVWLEGDRFTVASVQPEGCVAHATGRWSAAPMVEPPPVDLRAARARCAERVSGDDFYARSWRPGEHELGPSFRRVAEIFRCDGEALAAVNAAALDAPWTDAGEVLGFSLGEVNGQVLMPAVPGWEEVAGRTEFTYLGHGVARSVAFGRPLRGVAWCHACLVSFDGMELVGDVSLLDTDGRALARVEGLRVRRVARASLRRSLGIHEPIADASPAPDGGDELLLWVRRHAAAVLGAPVDEVPAERSWVDLGLDSMMAAELAGRLSGAPGGAPSVATLLDAGSAWGLVARWRVGGTPAQAPEVASPEAGRRGGARWRRLREGGATRVFAVPHAGAGPQAFAGWRDVQPGLALWSADLPARGDRLHEPGVTDWGALVSGLADELPTDDAPYALFGASLGGWIAFAVAREIVRRGARPPSRLVVAASPAPIGPHPMLAHGEALRAALDEGPGATAAALLGLGLLPEALATPAALPVVLPAVRADLELATAWAPRPATPLPLPITALGGREDGVVTSAWLAAWADYTAVGLTRRMLPGGHLFWRDRAADILGLLA